MERYKTDSKYMIESISHSDGAFSLIHQPASENVLLTFMPRLFVNEESKVLSPVLTAFFVDEKEHEISTKLLFRMDFLVKNDLPIKINDGKIEVTDFGMIISMFDTTIGAFRGVFFDWLRDSPFLKPLPLVDLDDFLRNLNVSFVKSKE